MGVGVSKPRFRFPIGSLRHYQQRAIEAERLEAGEETSMFSCFLSCQLLHPAEAVPAGISSSVQFSYHSQSQPHWDSLEKPAPVKTHPFLRILGSRPQNHCSKFLRLNISSSSIWSSSSREKKMPLVVATVNLKNKSPLFYQQKWIYWAMAQNCNSGHARSRSTGKFREQQTVFLWRKGPSWGCYNKTPLEGTGSSKNCGFS